MQLDIEGRTALVTGASADIGAASAASLAAEGARVIAVARRTERLAAYTAITADLTEEGAIARVAAEAGPVDILVNCAGASRPTTLEGGDKVWDEAFALNFTATRKLTEACLPAMRQRGWGRIINISGSMEPHGLNAAIAAKAAVHLWAKGLSRDIAREGITINCIQPGRIDSEQIRERLYPTEESRRAFIATHVPAGYFGAPEDVAALATFLASPSARYITGAVIPVDGGMYYFGH